MVNRYGEKIRKHLEESKGKTNNWTQQEWALMSAEWKKVFQPFDDHHRHLAKY